MIILIILSIIMIIDGSLLLIFAEYLYYYLFVVFTYSSPKYATQWAAVRTYLLLIKLPPHLQLTLRPSFNFPWVLAAPEVAG
jgi:hypothetical protein